MKADWKIKNISRVGFARMYEERQSGSSFKEIAEAWLLPVSYVRAVFPHAKKHGFKAFKR